MSEGHERSPVMVRERLIVDVLIERMPPVPKSDEVEGLGCLEGLEPVEW